MKRLLKKICIVLLSVLIVSGVIVIHNGYETYQKAIQTTPIHQAVSNTIDQIEPYIPYEDIDANFVNAVIATEDKRYFVRNGFDWIALTRAMIHNMRYQKPVEGGSTISQQIAKNLYHQSINRSYKEKIAEVFIMNDLEQQYSKQDLFALYANMNYYGDGCHGINQASTYYYNVKPNNLDLPYASMLAGLPNAPSILQLSTGYNLAKKRQEYVLKRMLEERYITKDEYNNALTIDVHSVHH